MKLNFLSEHASLIVAVGLVAGAVLGSVAVSAWVAPVPEAYLTTVEGVSVPDSVGFQIDQAAANCPANTWIYWDGGSGFPRATADETMRRANVRSMTQILMAQKIAGAKIRVYASNSATNVNCRVDFIHAL